jgi:hypothetical protein
MRGQESGDVLVLCKPDGSDDGRCNDEGGGGPHILLAIRARSTLLPEIQLSDRTVGLNCNSRKTDCPQLLHGRFQPGFLAVEDAHLAQFYEGLATFV